MGPKDRKSVGKFFLWPVPRHLTSDMTLKDDIDKSGFLAAASHFGRLNFGAKISQIGLQLFPLARSPSFDLGFDLEG